MAPVFEYLLQISGPDIPPEARQTVTLPVGIGTIGRQPGSAVWLNDLKVSRNHASIECTEIECIIIDTGSANGTFVNGEKLPPQTPTLLRPGDKIVIGPFEMTLERVAAAEIPPLEAETEAEPEVVEPAAHEPVAESLPAPVEAFAGKEAGQAGLPPPPPPPPVFESIIPAPQTNGVVTVEELIQDSRRLLSYLPGIYDTSFMQQFMRVFESILLPIEWTIDNFDLYLDPATAPSGFIPWLSNWYQLVWNKDWSEAQQRQFLKDSHAIYARRGTRWALERVLEIYLGFHPQVIDLAEDLAPHTFRVRLPLRQEQVNCGEVEALINANKPAYTTYLLEFDS